MNDLAKAINCAKNLALECSDWDAADDAADAYDVDRDDVLQGMRPKSTAPRLHKATCPICRKVSWVPYDTDRCACGSLYCPTRY